MQLHFYMPMWQYFETFVRRNPLVRDKILFQVLFLDADQVYFFKIQAREQRHRFSALACRPLH